MLILEPIVAAVTARCLRSAARRWPQAIREDQHAEWTAEMAALRAETPHPIRSAWYQLRFAVSLATAPAVEEPDPTGARSLDVVRLDRHGRLLGTRLLGPAVALLAIPVLALVIGALALFVMEEVFALTGDGDLITSRFVFVADWGAQVRIDWKMHALNLLGCAIAGAVMALLGRRLGGRLPLWAAHRGSLAIAGSAIAAPILVTASGVLLWLAIPTNSDTHRSIVSAPDPNYLAGALTWVVGTAAAGWWLTHHRRTWPWIVLAAILTSGLAVTVAGARSAQAVGLSLGTAPAWFPMSLLSPDGWAAPDQPLHPLTAVSSQLFDLSVLALLCSGFVLAYGTRAADLVLRLTPVDTRAKTQ